MQLKDVFRALSFGSLSGTMEGNEGNGSIHPKREAAVTHYINDGLLRLASRFVLVQKDVMVEMVAHITNYHLKRRFSEVHGDPAKEQYLYIKDMTDEPFEEDVLKILEVYNSHGIQLPLNDSEQPASLFTPQANVLQVPHPRAGAALSILYQAKHPTLSHTEQDAEIILPDVLFPALYAYVAYSVYSAKGTAESLNKAGEQMVLFDTLCQEALDRDLVSTSEAPTNARFHKRGWI